MKFEYDQVGDILYVDLAPIRDEHTMREIAEGVLLREDTASCAIEGLEIHGFLARLSAEKGIDVPISAAFKQPTAASSGA